MIYVESAPYINFLSSLPPTQIIAVFVTIRFRNQRDPLFDLPVRAVFPKENYEYC